MEWKEHTCEIALNWTRGCLKKKFTDGGVRPITIAQSAHPEPLALVS